jgi:hypothetical protein
VSVGWVLQPPSLAPAEDDVALVSVALAVADEIPIR